MRTPIAICVLAAVLVAAPGRPRVVNLSDGSRYIGRVVENECTDELLVMTELRSGAKRSIPWSAVRSDEARTLRIELGFEVEEGEASKLRMDGHRIVNKAGTIFEGMLTNEETWKKDGTCILKTSEGMRKIRVGDIRDGPTSIQIDKLQVFTPEELYEREVKENPPETAEQHFQQAERCRIYGALAQAKEHYEACLAKEDPKYTRTKIQRLIDKVDRRLASAEADGELKEIKKAIVYNKFAKATELITAFKEKYKGDEDWIKEVDELAVEMDERRTGYYVTQVPRLMRDTVKSVLAKKVKEESEWTLRQAQQFASAEPSAEDSASRHAIDAIAEKLGIKPEEVLDFWNKREKRVIHKGFYRDGTFIVVDNLQDALSKAPKIKAVKGGPTPPKPHKARTPDEWWNGKVKARKWSDLRDWLYAYWAERSNMCEILEPKEEGCAVCAGKGYTQGLHQTQQGTVPFFDRCMNCHMATYHRVVRFK